MFVFEVPTQEYSIWLKVFENEGRTWLDKRTYFQWWLFQSLSSFFHSLFILSISLFHLTLDRYLQWKNFAQICTVALRISFSLSVPNSPYTTPPHQLISSSFLIGLLPTWSISFVLNTCLNVYDLYYDDVIVY